MDRSKTRRDESGARIYPPPPSMAAPPHSGSGPSVADGGSYPRWVMLEHKGYDVRNVRKYSAGGSTGNPKTAAIACTFAGGKPVRVSFCLEAPPAASRMFFDFEAVKQEDASMVIVAAHGDSVLIKMEYYDKQTADDVLDYFVYNAGDAAADPTRPPSLMLLPHNYVAETMQDDPCCNLDMDVRATGILRRGDDEFVVAELITKESDMPETELLLLRSGEWSLKRTSIIHDDGKGPELSDWKTDMVVPIGDRRLCWVDLYRGVILCDPFDESPRLQYVSLPVDPPKSFEDDCRDSPAIKRSVCVTDGGDALKFVKISPRCCCGSRGTTTCDHSLNAFVINTWTLRIDGDGDGNHNMSWTMDAMIDATELWDLKDYAKARLPRFLPEFPVVSMDSPHHISFVLCNRRRHKDESDITSLIKVDTRSKTLLSVCRYYEKQLGRPSCSKTYYRPSKISDYLKLLPTSSIGFRMRMDFAPPVIVITKAGGAQHVISNSSQCSSSEPSAKRLKMPSEVVASPEVASSPEEILATLNEIPELDCDDLLRAYSILCHDNGRRFRSLLGLPMSLRKKWLLMEINISEACSNCSACRTGRQHE